MTGILAAPIRVVNQPFGGLSHPIGHRQCINGQLRLHTLVHGPAADNSAGKQVHNNGQVHPAFKGPHIGYVDGPHAVGLIDIELPVEKVCSHGKRMAAVGGNLIAPGSLGLKTKLTHHPANLVYADLVAFFMQLLHDPSGPVFTAVFFENGAYPRCQGGLGRIVIRPLVDALDVLLKTAPADPHHLAQHSDRIGLNLLPDKIESYFDSLAKKAAAFFKISRSISRRLFSLRKRLSSLSSCSRVRPSVEAISC